MIKTITLRLTYEELEAILISLDYCINNRMLPEPYREKYTKAYDHIFTKIEEIEKRVKKNGTN